MSYNSKKNIASMLAGVLLMGAYIVYALGQSSPGAEDLAAWAVAMLVFIGIGVAAAIVIQILFHFVFVVGIAIKEREQDDAVLERIISSTIVEDERDKMIEAKSAQVGYVFAGIGFLTALVILAFGMSALMALHTIFGAFFLGSIVEGGRSIYHYERGV